MTFLDSHTCNQICTFLKLPAKRSKAPKYGGTLAMPPVMAGFGGTRAGTQAKHPNQQQAGVTDRIQEVIVKD